MDKLNAMRVFAEVASSGSFAAAARNLGIAPASVTRLVGELETDVDARLFNRTTRAVALTEAGETYLARVEPILNEIDDATEELRARRSRPSGRLRLTSVISFGQVVLTPLAAEFRTAFPEVKIDLHLSNRTCDLVEEHFDLAIRIGSGDGLKDSALLARRIFTQKLIFVATPAYVERHGAPNSLDDLSSHHLVKQISGTWGVANRFQIGGRDHEVRLAEDFVVNSPNAARNAILTGAVMGLQADYLVRELIKEGRLLRLLPELETAGQDIHAVYVHRKYMPAKTRCFLDFISERLSHFG